MATLLPVFLLDVDGVINAATTKPDRNVWPLDQWVEDQAFDGARTFTIRAARPVADFIREVHKQGRAEIRWHTTWREHARNVANMLDLPEFPVAEAPEWTAHLLGETSLWWKIGAALRVVENERRPLVWADDDADSFWNLPRDVRRRIEAAQPTLIVAPSSYTGLCPKHLRKIDAFLTECAETTAEEATNAHP